MDLVSVAPATRQVSHGKVITKQGELFVFIFVERISLFVLGK